MNTQASFHVYLRPKGWYKAEGGIEGCGDLEVVNPGQRCINTLVKTYASQAKHISRPSWASGCQFAIPESSLYHSTTV